MLSILLKKETEKDEWQREINQKIIDTQQEKSSIEEQHEKIKILFKESEFKFNKKISELQKDIAVLKEKLKNSEKSLNELQLKYNSEIQTITEEFNAFKAEALDKDREFEFEMDSLQNLYKDVLQDKNDIAVCSFINFLFNYLFNN